MPIPISHRVDALAVSQTIAMSQRALDLRAKGVDVINLSVGEPDFDTPHHIKEAAKRAIDQNITRYPPVPGYPQLRQAIAERLNSENGANFSPQQIIVSAGAKHALCNTILATINPGDEVIIPTPTWVSYIELVKLAEGRPIELPAPQSQDFKITAAQLRHAITPRTRMLLLCSPSNPTGAVYSRAELQALVDVLADYPDIIVVADEIYQHIYYAPEPYTSMASFPQMAPRTVIINGVSKAYAMTGWRVGFMAGPLELAKAVSKLQGQTTSGISSISQMAALAAYTGPQECVETMRQAFERRRDLIVALARQIPGLKVNMPQGAFYIFPDMTAFLGRDYRLPDGTTRHVAADIDLAMTVLDGASVATVAGSAFGAPGHLRLSYAASDDAIRRAMAQLRALLMQNA